MRHRVKNSHLNRDAQHRRSLFANLVSSLIEHGSINTTAAKAKAVQPLVDKLLSKAKVGTVHQRRIIAKTLPRRATVNRLVDVIAPTTQTRTSGFTRITKLGYRRGDSTLMVRLELVDKVSVAPVNVDEVATKAKKSSAKKETKTSVKAKPTTKPAVAATKTTKDQVQKSQVNVAKQALTRTTSK